MSPASAWSSEIPSRCGRRSAAPRMSAIRGEREARSYPIPRPIISSFPTSPCRTPAPTTSRPPTAQAPWKPRSLSKSLKLRGTAGSSERLIPSDEGPSSPPSGSTMPHTSSPPINGWSRPIPGKAGVRTRSRPDSKSTRLSSSKMAAAFCQGSVSTVTTAVEYSGKSPLAKHGRRSSQSARPCPTSDLWAWFFSKARFGRGKRGAGRAHCTPRPTGWRGPPTLFQPVHPRSGISARSATA